MRQTSLKITVIHVKQDIGIVTQYFYFFVNIVHECRGVFIHIRDNVAQGNTEGLVFFPSLVPTIVPLYIKHHVMTGQLRLKYFTFTLCYNQLDKYKIMYNKRIYCYIFHVCIYIYTHICIVLIL